MTKKRNYRWFWWMLAIVALACLESRSSNRTCMLIDGRPCPGCGMPQRSFADSFFESTETERPREPEVAPSLATKENSRSQGKP